jgi:hypothetical protein
MTRLTLEMNAVEMIIVLSEGNPGAVTVMSRLFQEAPSIDPQAALGGYGYLFDLDALSIYGPRIWMLYKDVCKEDLLSMVALLRANQLGFLNESSLNNAIDNYGQGIDLPEILKRVEEELEEFNKGPLAQG